MIRRVRYIGEPLMPLTETYPYGVLFVGGTTTTNDGRLFTGILGTGFLVSIGESLAHAYIVTARHVVHNAKTTYVRVPIEGGSEPVVDLPVPEWFKSDERKDVAVCPIDLPVNHTMVSTNLTQFVDDPSWDEDKEWLRTGMRLELGDLVYFIGLLGKIEAMTEAGIPIVRSGTLARLWQDDMPVVEKDGTERRITAHLIDCRSFGGFSGSPCYVEHSRAGIVQVESGPAVTTKYRTSLLGMIGGHFDDWANVKSQYGASDFKAPVNTGVGYVLPAEYIRETLMHPDLERERLMADARNAKSADETAATQDSAAFEQNEYERFETLTQELVQTPKPKPAKDDEPS
jgi:hypothetical protein